MVYCTCGEKFEEEKELDNHILLMASRAWNTMAVSSDQSIQQEGSNIELINHRPDR